MIYLYTVLAPRPQRIPVMSKPCQCAYSGKHTTRTSSRLLQQFLHTSSFRTCQIARRGLHSHTRVTDAHSVVYGRNTGTITRRTFTSTSTPHTTFTSHPPGSFSELVVYPTEDALKALEDVDSEDPEVELVPPQDATLGMTERAAEVRSLPIRRIVLGSICLW